MINHKKIGVVVPAHNEAKMIRQVIETMPRFVDKIILVDDASPDKTIKIAQEVAKKSHHRLDIISFKENRGVGAAIIAGYKRAVALKIDATAVMAGDAQMDPAELKALCLPIIKNEAEYVKGNRLIYGRAWEMMPKVRYFGNSILSLLTKITSGYWHVADSQTGYTAISLQALKNINLDDLYERYGFPNDLLVHLNIIRARVKEMPIKPIYHVGGKSGIRLWKVIPTIGWLLIRRFFWRMKIKYIIEDFHPLVFFYFSAILLSFVDLVLLGRLLWFIIAFGEIRSATALAFFFCLVMASQFTFFGMWLDMDYNKDLKVK